MSQHEADIVSNLGHEDEQDFISLLVSLSNFSTKVTHVWFLKSFMEDSTTVLSITTFNVSTPTSFDWSRRSCCMTSKLWSLRILLIDLKPDNIMLVDSSYAPYGVKII